MTDSIKFNSLDSRKLSLLDLAGLIDESLFAGKAASPFLGTLGITALNVLEGANNTFQSKLITVKANPITELITGSDDWRDDNLGEIKITIKAALKSSIPEKANAGKTLGTFMNPYQHVAKEPIMSETTAIRHMQAQYNTNPALQAAAATLQLTEVFANLFSANEQVANLWNERAIDDAEKNGPSPSSLRSNVEKAYYDFCDVVVQTVKFQPTPELETLFSVMNDIRIKYSKFLPVKLTNSNTIVDAIAKQKYTGKEITPITRVFYKKEDGELNELRFTIDFYITYRNNVEVGEAQIIIHGKGKYRGRYTSIFHIEKEYSESGFTE
jgi:hypothetical protein